MAKGKKDFTLEEEDFQVRPSKLPIDSTGAGKTLTGYQELPVTMLHPYTQKNGDDFSRHDEMLSERFVETVRAVGIIEALIVRRSSVKIGMYEIIAGESRWNHARSAGIETVPCRIMELTDEQAKLVFNITNLMRREMTFRDKINGWYAFFHEMKGKSSCTEELRQMIEEDQLGVMSVAGGSGLKLRTIYRYVKMHDLISEWIDRLEAGTVTSKAGEKLASFPADIQRALLPYKVTESKLAWLLEIYRGKNKKITWSPKLIADYFELMPQPEENEKKSKPAQEPLTKEEKAAQRQQRKYNKAFKQSTQKLLDTAREKIPPEDYERADEIVAQALELYYKQVKD